MKWKQSFLCAFYLTHCWHASSHYYLMAVCQGNCYISTDRLLRFYYDNIIRRIMFNLHVQGCNSATLMWLKWLMTSATYNASSTIANDKGSATMQSRLTSFVNPLYTMLCIFIGHSSFYYPNILPRPLKQIVEKSFAF